MDAWSDRPATPALRMLPVVQGAALMATALIAGLATYVVTGLLETAARKNLEPDEIHRLAEWCFGNRPWLPLLALPALLCGLVVTRTRRRRWAWILVGAIAVLAPVSVVLACFVAVLAPLYQFRPL